jgi:hypothetical protein
MSRLRREVGVSGWGLRATLSRTSEQLCARSPPFKEFSGSRRASADSDPEDRHIGVQAF